MQGLANNNITSSVHRVTVAALLVTVGIVFGDIGTSPLYVMKTIMHVQNGIDADYVTGAVSCIIWTLTLQTTIKYVLIALRADNRGEGGILALYALIKKLRHKWIYVLAVIGASTLIADGVITPAVTVTSAVEGLNAMSNDAPVMPIVLMIITAVFMIQQFGPKVIGRFFGPFMLCWFLMLGVLGSLSIKLHIGILSAFNPVYAIRLLVDSPGWFLILGAVFLCTTGAEALYSDLGHCGRRNIAISWIFVKIMLILNYLGQGAWIISRIPSGDVTGNPFYSIMPAWFLPFGIFMSTGAAIIASQALLSGSFTIFSEAMSLGLWPRMRINYPTNLKGQLYIPMVNILLYIGCVATILLFGSSDRMEAAYGLAITITMLMTTVLLAFYLRYKGVSMWLVILFAFVYLVIEGAFFTANAFKFMHGGWFTVLIAGIVCGVMLIWRKAKLIRNKYIQYVDIGKYGAIINDIKNDDCIPEYAANLVFISRASSSVMVECKIVYSIINKQPKRADHYWLLRVEYVDTPDTLEYDYDVIIPQTLISVSIRIGFRVRPQVSVYLRQIVEDLVNNGVVNLISRYPSLRIHGVDGNFRFVIIHRIFSASSSCGGSDRLLMQLYSFISRLGVSDEKALGLDTSNLTVENVPLIINNRTTRRIVRAERP